MDISNLDIISPKIFLYHRENNSHKSNFGGFLSIIFFIISVLLCIFYFVEFISLRFQPILIYSTYSNKNVFYSLNETSIYHYIQIYRKINNQTFLEEINTRNILIYGIESNTDNINNVNNINEIEHWLYGICQLNENNEDNGILENSTIKLMNCIKYYYNPVNMKYYKLNEEGFKYPVIATGNKKEKNLEYKIIIEKCNNYSIITDILGYCNDENLINNYLQKYTDIFTFLSDNQIIPYKNELILKDYTYSISANINNNEDNLHYENIIYYSILKLKTNKKVFLSNNYNEKSIYTLNNFFQYEKQNYSSSKKIIAIFKINLNNKIQIYQRDHLSILYILSLLGGIIHLIFSLLRLLNYYHHNFTVISDVNILLTRFHSSKEYFGESPEHKMIDNRLFKESDIKKKERRHPINKLNQMKGRRAPSLFERKTRQKLIKDSKESMDLKSKTIAGNKDSDTSGIYNHKIKKS